MITEQVEMERDHHQSRYYFYFPSESWAHLCKLKTSNDDPEVPGYFQSSSLWVLAGLLLCTSSSSGGKSRMNVIISRPIPGVKAHLPKPCDTNPEIGHVGNWNEPFATDVRDPCLSLPELITMERNQVAVRCGLQRSSSISVFCHQCWSLVSF